jgi:hypothetical protein
MMKMKFLTSHVYSWVKWNWVKNKTYPISDVYIENDVKCVWCDTCDYVIN